MRDDYKHLALNTGRHRRYYSILKKHRQQNRKQRSLNDSENPGENLPEREKMRPPGSYLEQRDRLNPFYRYLYKQVGRKWNDVYSEICKYNDNRSLRGYHLRQHVQDLVRSFSEWEASKPYFMDDRLYVDENGVLAKVPRNKINWFSYKKYREKPLDPNKRTIEGRNFEKINGVWFEITAGTKERRMPFRKQTARGMEIGFYYYTEPIQVKRTLSKKEIRWLLSQN